MTNSDEGSARDPRGRRSRAQIFERLDAAIAELAHFGGMPKQSEAEAIWSDIWHLEAHNSTAIEGNTLALREVRELLDDGRTVGRKELSEYLEVRGYGTAASWVYSQALSSDEWGGNGTTSVSEIRYIHELAMTPVWVEAPVAGATPREGPGGFREHEIRQFSGGMTPPSWVHVPSLVSRWVEEVDALTPRGSQPTAELVVQLAGLHAEFERIHPFIDGNGRVGRLVLNLILVRLGLPPVIVFKQDRTKYLRGLDRADQGDAAPLAELLSRSIIDNLHRFVVPGIAGPARQVPLESLADERISYAALRQAANRGRLVASRASDGSWRSSRHAVDQYLASKYQRTQDT